MKINRLVRTLILTFAAAASFLLIVPNSAYASSLFGPSAGQACSGAQLQDGAPCDPKTSTNTINTAITFALNFLSFAVGIASVIMIVIAGFKFVTAGGDTAAVGSARNTILYAVIGLAVVALAQVIVHFVLHRL